MKFFSVSLTLDPQKGLLSQRLFWIAMLIPFFFFLILGVPIWMDYKVCFSSDCYKVFLEVSQLPLLILALCLPFSIAVARAHSTEQAARQIVELTRNNKIERFYKDKDEFNQAVGRKIKVLADRYRISGQRVGYEEMNDITYYSFVIVDRPSLNVKFNRGSVEKIIDSMLKVSKEVEKNHVSLSDEEMIFRLNNFSCAVLEFHLMLPDSISCRFMYQIADPVALKIGQGLNSKFNIIPMDTQAMKEVEGLLINCFFKMYDSLIVDVPLDIEKK